MGKISQAAIVAGAAYRNQETFRKQTGIVKSRLIRDKVYHDTKVAPKNSVIPAIACQSNADTCKLPFVCALWMEDLCNDPLVSICNDAEAK